MQQYLVNIDTHPIEPSQPPTMDANDETQGEEQGDDPCQYGVSASRVEGSFDQRIRCSLISYSHIGENAGCIARTTSKEVEPGSRVLDALTPCSSWRDALHACVGEEEEGV